jgi:hypothetical protein
MSIVRTAQPPLSKAMYFNGINAYVVIPLIVYRWSGITVQEWLYPFHPKANPAWSKFSMIGDYGTDFPSVFYGTDNRYDYTGLGLHFTTRKFDGTRGFYGFSFYDYRNAWVNVAYRFSLTDRVFAGYINGARVYTATVPSTEYTILEWNPDTATYPHLYKRFVLGANVLGGENMKMMQGSILVYSRSLTDSEVVHNMLNPNSPIRDGLVLWLDARACDTSRNICYDLSGNNNHGTMYNVSIVTLPNQIAPGMVV